MPLQKRERPATAADVQAILSQLEELRADIERQSITVSQTLLVESQRLWAEVEKLRERLPPPPNSPPGLSPSPASCLPEQYVTLDQIGAMVHRSKRSMERYRSQMPPPRVRGRRGQPHLWA